MEPTWIGQISWLRRRKLEAESRRGSLGLEQDGTGKCQAVFEKVRWASCQRVSSMDEQTMKEDGNYILYKANKANQNHQHKNQIQTKHKQAIGSCHREEPNARIRHQKNVNYKTSRRLFSKRCQPKLSLQVILVRLVIAAALACWLPPLLLFENHRETGKLAQAYQLTNNLIANNLPPKFQTTSGAGSNSEIVVRVKEGPNSIGKLIYTLKGEDPDEDPLTFGVLGSTASDLLRIENVPGNQANVYLRKELDRETTESHQVVITLTDGKLGRGNWVEDVNDNYPVFGPHRTTISVREDAKTPLIIETIEASDQDEGRFGQVIYKLDDSLEDSRGAPLSSIFNVETIDGKGVISLIGQLDYEQRPLYQLRLLATDRAIENERLTTSTSILVSVEDCEDQPPMFTFVPSITRIPENLAIGSPVVRLTAVDGDRGINNKISYKLLAVNGQESGPERQLFALDSESGQISVAGKLDRESSPVEGWLSSGRKSEQQPGSYVLQIRATELNSAQHDVDNSVTTELTVLLTDVNDEPPTFNQASYFGEILENSPPESLVNFVSRPMATNAINNLQQETSSNEQAKVVDRDQGTNGTFTLSLEGEHGKLFEIWPREATNEANFLIKISPGIAFAELDFERRKQFQFRLIAREKYGDEQRSSWAQMSVFLRDSNDNYPQFEQELYKVEIPENAIKGMHVCQVKASDIDSGAYGSEGIRYTEIRGEKANKFRLDPLTGIITLKTSEHGFDRETVAQHHLIIEARDSNGQGNRNTTQLLIQLTDVNDQPPKFLLDQYEAFIYENELDFQSPLQVQAIDNDQANTANSKLSYSIVAGDPQGNFTIEPNTGRIKIRNYLAPSSPNQPRIGDGEDQGSQLVTMNAGLDFERIAQKRDDSRQFNLTVKATDSGVPEPLSDTTNVIVLVYDKNDHAPVFTRPIYHKSIKEDAKEGSQVLQVLAQDGDHSPTNSKITYRISSGASDKFVVDSDSGLISVASGANLDIDRASAGQKRTNYLLSVLAFDGSFGPNQKSASALVNITIIDVNNKAPEFTTLGASRSQLTYSGPSPNQQTNLAPTQQAQQFMVVNVNEDAPYGLIVTKVVATDLDSSADLRYSINYARSEARNEDMQLVEPSLIKDLFSMEPTEGTLRVAKPLDRETFDQIKLRLQVEDIAAQTADQIAYAHLLVKITDVNDNRPTFKRNLYKAVVNENSISGTSVITLTADDRDLNKTLKYSLEGPPEVLRLVRINSRSGEVTVNDKIDRELHSLLNVTVKAEDFGHPHSLTGSAILLITVRDENDNNPAFVNSTQLQRHPTREVELNDNSNQPKNHNMNDTTYRLRSLSPTHRSFDEMQPSRSKGIPLDVDSLESIIVDEPSAADNHLYGSLQLLSPGSTARISEDAPVGQQLAYVRAEDVDVGNNGRVTYLLDAISSGGKFRIDRDTGIISVAGPLDRETAKQYSLIIEACDNYDLGYSTGESRRAFTQVNIIITDVNDNAPIISSNLQTTQSTAFSTVFNAAAEVAQGPSYDEVMSSPGPYEIPLSECLFISEFQPIKEPILTITATDADDPNTPNGQLDLQIVNNLPHNELFGLVAIPSSTTRNSQTSSITTSTTMLTTDILSGFGDLSIGESSSSPSSIEATDSRQEDDEPGMRIKTRPKRATQTTSASLLEPVTNVGNFYTNNRLPSTVRGVPQRNPIPITTTIKPTTRTPTQIPQIVTTTGSPPSLTISATMSTVHRRHQRPTSQSFYHNSISDGDAGEQQVHVVVNQSLKERVGNYSILIRATDRGQPALSSVKLINICVQDVNNHAPVFLRPPLNHTIRIHENATLGTFVTQVEASDSDHGLNGELQYSLKQNVKGNDWQWFKIDRITGVISTAKLFNRQLQRYYTLRVQASDFGKPTSLSSDVDVNIMIVNSGQYQPEFDIQTQLLQFTENVAPGVEWFTLLPTTNLEDDPALININAQPAGSLADKATSSFERNNSTDQASWLATPCYFIVDGDDSEQIFHLDRYTHHLTNQKIIDRERKANYTLVVQASNSCSKHPGSTSSLRAPANKVPELSNGKELSTAIPSHSIDYRSSSVESNSDQVVSVQAKDLILGSIRQRRSTKHSEMVNKSMEALPKTAKLSSNHELQDRFTSGALDALIAADKTLLKVVIKIKDVNDNSPKFTQKVYTGGITTEADFGTVFMIVQATDADSDQNGQVVYSLLRPIKRNMASANFAYANSTKTRHKRASTPTTTTTSSTAKPVPQYVNTLEESSGDIMSNDILESGLTDELFVINSQTGEISLNFDPQKHMKGYFEFEVMANDTDGLFDSAKVFIYLLRQDQRIKFVLRLTPQELRQRLNKFRSVIGNITGALVNIDSYKYYENHDGTVDKKKTSLYLHFVNPEDNTIIEVDKVLTLIDNNIEYLDELYKEFHVLSSEAAQLPLGSSALIDPSDQVRTGLMGISSFLALILILLIALFLNQRSRYERQLKAVTVTAFGSSPLHLSPDFQGQSNLPNTNLHSQDPNPIWVNGYDHDWLGAGGQVKRKSSRGQSGNVNVAIEADADYLSSENSDSLSGVNSVHYNAATTATPRDSLSSSQGRVSGSAGSGSTTNERQALCQASSGGRSETPTRRREHPENLVGVLKNAKPQIDENELKKRSQQLNGNDTTHSTFGAYKEVTIYTDHQLESKQQRQVARPSLFSQQSLVKSVENKQQQTSQVSKIASQINAKQQQSNVNKSQVYIGQHQQHRIMVHANGADVSHGIIKTNQQQSASRLQNQQGSGGNRLAGGYTGEQAQESTTDNIDNNLNKLNIFNLETTEL